MGTLHSVSVVVVSRPGILRQSLLTVLAAFPWINVVGETGDGLNALALVTQRQPDLLVIDANLLDDEVETLLGAIQAHHPQLGSLVIRYSHHQQGQLLAAGARAVVLRDSSAHELEQTLRKAAHIA